MEVWVNETTEKTIECSLFSRAVYRKVHGDCRRTFPLPGRRGHSRCSTRVACAVSFVRVRALLFYLPSYPSSKWATRKSSLTEGHFFFVDSYICKAFLHAEQVAWGCFFFFYLFEVSGANCMIVMSIISVVTLQMITTFSQVCFRVTRPCWKPCGFTGSLHFRGMN